MALYTFVGFLCSFIAVDVAKVLISKNTSGFIYALNVLAVALLSIVVANILGLAWLWVYSELIVKVWFLDLYHFGRMSIAYLGSSLWMSIFFVPLFLYRYIKNRVNNKKWIYTVSLIIILLIPLVNIIQYGERAESNSLIPQPKDSTTKDDIKSKSLTELKTETDLIILEQLKLEEELRRLDALDEVRKLKAQINIRSKNCNEYLGNGNKYVEYSSKLFQLKKNVNDENYLETKAAFIECLETKSTQN
tara:strand:- start:426 stop:1169 length:744 start_codon:yes stop_codon:yes gene_type:complete